MAGQKSQRPSKRHLVRWTDDMDKKLLLTIQSVCNADGIKIPWDKVGNIMGDKISDGAVIQHLAKLRQRMVNQGLSVPPPLRRGGGAIISTNYSGGSSTRKFQQKGALADSVKHTNDEDEGSDVDKASDMDEQYTKTRSKRAKRGKTRTKIKVEDSNEDMLSEEGEQGAKRKKRKYNAAQTDSDKDHSPIKHEDMNSVYHGRRSSINYAELNGGYDSNEEQNSDMGQEYVGAAPPYMNFSESDEEIKTPVKQSESASAIPSKVVVLHIRKSSLSSLSSKEQSHVTTEEHVKNEARSDGDTGLNAEGLSNNSDPMQFGAGLSHGNAFDPTAAHGIGTLAGLPYDAGFLSNHGWPYFHRSFQGGFPGPYSHPPPARVYIPQQPNGPSVDMTPPSATSTYSDRTPALLNGYLDSFVDDGIEGAEGIQTLNTAYQEPARQDAMLGPDVNFDNLLNFGLGC